MILRNGKFSGKILRKIFWKIFHLTSLLVCRASEGFTVLIKINENKSRLEQHWRAWNLLRTITAARSKRCCTFLITVRTLCDLSDIWVLVMTALWDVALYGLDEEDRRFGAAYCLYHQGDLWRQYAPLKRRSTPTRLYGATFRKLSSTLLAAARKLKSKIYEFLYY
jgi:hypothetical protein